MMDGNAERALNVTIDVLADSLVRRPRREPSHSLVSTLPCHDGHGCPSVRKLHEDTNETRPEKGVIRFLSCVLWLQLHNYIVVKKIIFDTIRERRPAGASLRNEYAHHLVWYYKKFKIALVEMP